MREEVAQTVEKPEDVDEELRYLCAALAAARGMSNERVCDISDSVRIRAGVDSVRTVWIDIARGTRALSELYAPALPRL